MAVEGYPFAGHFGDVKLLGRVSPCCKNNLMSSLCPLLGFWPRWHTQRTTLVGWGDVTVLGRWSRRCGLTWRERLLILMSPTFPCAWGSMKLPKPAHLGVGATLGVGDTALWDFWLQHPKEQCWINVHVCMCIHFNNFLNVCLLSFQVKYCTRVKECPQFPFAPAKPVRILSHAWETTAEEPFLLSLSFSLCNEKNNLSLLDFKIILFCQGPTPTSSSTGWTLYQKTVLRRWCVSDGLLLFLLVSQELL